MAETRLSLGEGADESAWRAMVDAALKGAPWDKLYARTADGLAIAPLYRETDFASSADASGFVGAAPFTRGARTQAGWLIRQSYAHDNAVHTNREILEDLAGGVGAIELVIDDGAQTGVRLDSAKDLDAALADVILEAAPVGLDAGARGIEIGAWLAARLKGAAGAGVAFNVDPLGALMRRGAMAEAAIADAGAFAARISEEMPAASALRVDARPVHEAGGTPAQEIAAALCAGIAYLREFETAGVTIDKAGALLLFTLSVGPDMLTEAAKLRALRLCWARVMEAAGAAPEARAAHIHAVTSRRMMSRCDAWTNILRVTCAAFAAGVGGAQAITTLPLTDALGLPTGFARRVARNIQLILLEEAHVGAVADPAGGSWFVEAHTHELAHAAWAKMQAIEAHGGLVAALRCGAIQREVAEARAAREKAVAHRRETITGVTDYPLLGARAPEFVQVQARSATKSSLALSPMRWAAPFEDLRARAEGRGTSVFMANLGTLAAFSARANFTANLLAAGGVGVLGADTAYATLEAMTLAYQASGTRVAALCGTDEAYTHDGAAAARALKTAGCDWLVLAGKPGEAEADLRAGGVDQFVFVGQDALGALASVHAALGIR